VLGEREGVLMENEKFQELSDIQMLLNNQLRLEAKFDIQVNALHILRVRQGEMSVDITDQLDRIEAKLLQLETAAQIRRIK